MPLSDFKIPPFKYFPTHLMDSEGPKHWAKLRFLQACERASIPKELWPNLGGLAIPRKYGYSYQIADALTIPAFNPLYESETEWRERTRQSLEHILDKQALEFRAWFQRERDKGNLTPIKPVRDTSPLDLRYKWAARRYCLKVSFKSMETDQYSTARIKKVVYAILDELGLRRVK